MASNQVTSGDRLSLTLFISVAVHALIILGVGFTWGMSQRAQTPPLIEITLAENPQEETPDDYDYLAQADQDGGGQSEEPARPKKEQKAVTPGVPEGKSAVQAAPQPKPEPKQAEQAVVTSEDSETQAPEPEETAEQKVRTPDRSELIDASTQVARSSEFSTESRDVYARYPTKKRIDARTKQHAAAAYMREWVSKVEEVGNLNYPSEARTRGLSGTLILEVTLKPDGTLKNTRVLSASRHPVLDQAAQRIVEISSPFSRVPKEVLDGNDLLVITRTWEFREQGLTAN